MYGTYVMHSVNIRKESNAIFLPQMLTERIGAKSRINDDKQKQKSRGKKSINL